MKTNTIKIDGSNNIVLQNTKGVEIVINTSNAEDIHQKMQQLNNQQIGVLQQIEITGYETVN